LKAIIIPGQESVFVAATNIGDSVDDSDISTSKPAEKATRMVLDGLINGTLVATPSKV